MWPNGSTLSKIKRVDLPSESGNSIQGPNADPLKSLVPLNIKALALAGICDRLAPK